MASSQVGGARLAANFEITDTAHGREHASVFTMSRLVTIAFLLHLFCCSFLQGAADVTADQIVALAKTYFRDSAEIPMSVAVLTRVTDEAGKVKYQKQATVGMVFNGYNHGSGKFSLRANSGLLSAGAMRDSMSGDLASFFAGGLISRPNSEHTIEIQQPTETGKPALVLVTNGECPQLEMMPRWLFPRHPCGSARFSVNVGSDGRITFRHFAFESSGHSAPAKIDHLGDVQLLSFHAEVEFQEVVLPGDSKPFLWPMEAVTSVTTNKGQVTIRNQYSQKK